MRMFIYFGTRGRTSRLLTVVGNCMNDDTMLILAAAIAVGVGIWSLQKPISNITEPVGHALNNPFSVLNWDGWNKMFGW